LRAIARKYVVFLSFNFLLRKTTYICTHINQNKTN
jgi:hypothetical protein